MTVRWLIAPQELKGTLTAHQAAQVMQEAVHAARPDVEVDVAPLADGGPGTVDALLSALPGERRWVTVQDALGRPVRAAFALLEGGRTAVVEMAAACGLSLLAPAERNPLRTSTHGVGELMRAALDAGCERLIVGLGGSATNDGGAGALAALGMRLLGEGARPLPPGGAALRGLTFVDASGLHPRLSQVELVLATDVTSPLTGPDGASRLFGPQKGASEAQVQELELALTHFASLTAPARMGEPGAGAAGGLGFGLALVGGRYTSGFGLLAQVLGLEARVAAAGRVLTAEGRFDRQTALGKGPGALALLARTLSRPITLFCGSAAPDAPTGLFDEVLPLAAGCDAAQALREAVLHWAGTRQRG
ncbi:MAG TPA: glycerate kinase [Aggregicoccus sp.]|nr:glycerate kinase [Aggregicoccus sp.]